MIRLFDAEIAFNAESVTRSEITQEDVDGSKATVKVYATKDGSVFYDSKEIKRQSTGKWYVNVNQKDTWADGSGTSGNVTFNSTGTEYSITMSGGLVTISSGNNYIRQKSTATNVELGTYSDGRNWKFYQFVIDMP